MSSPKTSTVPAPAPAPTKKHVLVNVRSMLLRRSVLDEVAVDISETVDEIGLVPVMVIVEIVVEVLVDDVSVASAFSNCSPIESTSLT